jgi:hypothetical protein
MPGATKRYPGAAPFTDDAISRAVFFGRETESKALSNQIMAHRLVVVYAKSGLGKTSLLQAGVAQPLRDEGYCPLFVRVNDRKLGPLSSIFSSIGDTATRHKVEYVQGSKLSLWHFFKTVELWEEDRLLTPVLFLDQFEELFTLQAPHTRAAFLRELGHLVRGVRPASNPPPDQEPPLTDTPPDLRIVVSLREDFLGWFEEAADNIPQILDHRFLLRPLSVPAAINAMEGPARVQDAALATQPFEFEPTASSSIITYLSRRARRQEGPTSDYVEPFHLQLVCQRVESIAANRQRQGGREIQIGLD